MANSVLVHGESGARLNEIHPLNYPAQQSVAGKTHEQVKAELAEARANGQLNTHIGA